MDRVEPRKTFKNTMHRAGLSAGRLVTGTGMSQQTIYSMYDIDRYGRARKGTTRQTAGKIARAFARLANMSYQEAYRILFRDEDSTTLKAMADDLKLMASELQAQSLVPLADALEQVAQEILEPGKYEIVPHIDDELAQVIAQAHEIAAQPDLSTREKVGRIHALGAFSQQAIGQFIGVSRQRVEYIVNGHE